MKTSRQNRAYLKEGLLIVFSVLFALFIDKTFQDYQTNRQKNEALSSITRELSKNRDILNSWQVHHRKIRDRLTASTRRENDTLRAALESGDYLNLGLLTDQKPLVNELLTKTAWETARFTGILAEFDFETIQKLTRTYTMQDILMEDTLAKVRDTYLEKASESLDDLDQTLIKFQLLFQELVGQENLLEVLYDEALEGLGESGGELPDTTGP